jgi:hypothetical protein
VKETQVLKTDRTHDEDPKTRLKNARIRNLKDPVFRIIVRDLDYIKDDAAFNDPDFNAETYFQKANQATIPKVVNVKKVAKPS